MKVNKPWSQLLQVSGKTELGEHLTAHSTSLMYMLGRDFIGMVHKAIRQKVPAGLAQGRNSFSTVFYFY